MKIKQQYLCVKDWKIEGHTHFEKGKYYTGKPYNNGDSVEVKSEVGKKINFHKGSEYFDI